MVGRLAFVGWVRGDDLALWVESFVNYYYMRRMGCFVTVLLIRGDGVSGIEWG